MFELEVEREGLSYHPGDCTLLIRNDGIDSRPYSFSSHPDEPVLRFLVRTISGVDRGFSAWLDSLSPGAEVGIGTPFGWFRPGVSEREVWFATGTGVSPFLAALRADRPVRPLAFAIGVRQEADAVLRPWVDGLAPAHWAFSRNAQGARRVTDVAREVPVGDEIEYFLCGNERMIRAVADILTERGVPRRRIHEELFFR